MDKTTGRRMDSLARSEAPRPCWQTTISARQMRSAIPDWEVSSTAWETLAPSLRLPDADDVHVLAAAIAGHADCIVTTNLRHFPADVLCSYGVEAIHPDDFIINQLDLDPFTALAAFKEMRARWKKSDPNPEEFALALER